MKSLSSLSTPGSLHEGGRALVGTTQLFQVAQEK